MKKFKIIDNEVVLNPFTSNERNLTQEENECRYCKYDRKTCRGNKVGIYCDWFTMKEGWEEIDE